MLNTHNYPGQDRTGQFNYGLVTSSLVKRQKISFLYFGINPRFLPQNFWQFLLVIIGYKKPLIL